MTARCDAGCGYRLDGYGPGETTCGACLDCELRLGAAELFDEAVIEAERRLHRAASEALRAYGRNTREYRRLIALAATLGIARDDEQAARGVTP